MVQSVSENKRDRVDNYPRNMSVSNGGGVNKSRVTNHGSMSHKPRPDKNVTLTNKARFDMKTKVRNGIVATPCTGSAHKLSGSHDACTLKNNAFTPWEHKNRFWPLNELVIDQEEKVVVDEAQAGANFHEGKIAKNICNQVRAATDMVHPDSRQSDTVGGDCSHVTMAKTLNAVVNDHQFLAPTITVNKYDLALRFKPKYKDRIEQAQNSQIFKLWDNQTVGKFGYIPLTKQAVAQNQQKSQVNSNLLQVHEIVKQTGTYNFLDAQIPIPSQLKVAAWETNLKHYWDKQLLNLIQYGFPLSFDDSVKLVSTETNHSSARQYPNDIKVYLQEKAFNAILGPFLEPPISDLHVSPFLIREKTGSASCRVIVDLSFPPGSSVNAGVDPNSYLGSEFLLTLPSIDYITNQVLKLGKGSLIYKIDISRAFRHIKIDPMDYNLLGLNFNSYFIDTCLPFGFRHGSAIFQRLSDSIRYMMHCRGHHIITTRSQADSSFNTLYDLLGELGLDISKKKLVHPSTQASCLGVIINTENFTISVPDEKLAEIKQVCSQWEHKTYCSKCDLQSLLGRLLYVTKCVKASRPFLNRMLDLLRQADKQAKVVLTEDFHRDLNWFSQFLTKFNGVAFFSHDPVHYHIELDA